MLIYDLADPQELQGFVRGIQQEQEENRFVLSQILPNLNIDEIEFRVNRGDLRDEDAATLRAWDAESPIGGRQGVERMMGELAPISRKIRLGEEERLRRRALERNDNAGLVAAIYDDAAKMARAVAARIEMLRGEAITTAALDLNENGIVQAVDFGRDSDLEPGPATVWSNHADATPITDELAWLEVYRDFNGTNPGAALTSTAVFSNLTLYAQYRELASFQGISPAFLTPGNINAVRQAYGLPPIVLYDTKVRVNGVQQRVTPENGFYYVPPAGEPLGRTFLGTTAESLELVGAQQISSDQAPGMVSVVEKTFDPVATWTKAVAISLPVLINPNLTLAAEVQA